MVMEKEKMMEEEKRIVVAVDESEESMYALSRCLRNLLSQNTKGSTTTLVLLYVKPPLPVYSSLDATGYLFAGDVLASMEKYTNNLVNSVMRRAEAVYRDFNTNIKVEKKSRKWRCKRCDMYSSRKAWGRHVGHGKPRLRFLQEGTLRKCERSLCQARQVSPCGCEVPKICLIIEDEGTLDLPVSVYSSVYLGSAYVAFLAIYVCYVFSKFICEGPWLGVKSIE